MPARNRPLAQATRQLWFYSVQGSGSFPIDMLRYDRCWPASEGSDSAGIYYSHALGDNESRTVCLIGIDQPTERRWESFGWKVL
jgi:hypothetical protein